MNYRKIYIAIDDYELPNEFLDYGIKLAHSLNQSLRLVRVEKLSIPAAPIGITGNGGGTIQAATHIDEVIEVVDAKMEKLVAYAKNKLDHVDYSLEIGFPEPRLQELAEEDQPFLFLVQGHQESSLLNEWFGTTATRLAENMNVPTLVIHEDNRWKQVQNVLYIAHQEDDGDLNLEFLSQLTKDKNLKINVALVTEENVAERSPKFVRLMTKFHDRFATNQVSYSQISEDNAAQFVDSINQQGTFDWIVFQHQDTSVFDRIFGKFNTEHLILETNKPVLVL